MIGVPHAEAARPAGAAPPGSNDSREPTGHRTPGSRHVLPNNVVLVSIFDTSTHTRGRNARLSIAIRLRRNVVSLSAAPTRYPQVWSDSFLRATGMNSCRH